MACFHPLTAWRTPTGQIQIGKQNTGTPLRLPCGGCLGCRKNIAQAWTLRCQLELQQHQSAIFTTLTYDDDHLPLTLQKRHVQLWLKRLRKATTKISRNKLRHFLAGEYGERTHRPHYHALIYGLNTNHRALVENTWGHGHTRTEEITPARIAYTAGYCQKKIGYKRYGHERVDHLTGEVYTWQPAFKIMSKKPGIGGAARQWAKSWRLYAVKDGHKMPVPRFLHEAWKAQATTIQKEELDYDKYTLSLDNDTTEYTLRAKEKIAEAQQQETARKRHL